MSEVSYVRLKNWICFSLVNEFYWKDRNEINRQRCHNLLQNISAFCEFFKETLPIVEAFLTDFLTSSNHWNGFDYLDSLLTCLCYLNFPTSFENFKSIFLKPLKNLYFSSNPHIKVATFAFPIFAFFLPSKLPLLFLKLVTAKITGENNRMFTSIDDSLVLNSI